MQVKKYHTQKLKNYFSVTVTPSYRRKFIIIGNKVPKVTRFTWRNKLFEIECISSLSKYGYMENKIIMIVICRYREFIMSNQNKGCFLITICAIITEKQGV